MKSCSTSLPVKEMLIKTTITSQHIPIKTAKIQSSDNIKCWLGYGDMDQPGITGGNII